MTPMIETQRARRTRSSVVFIGDVVENVELFFPQEWF
jgi:hypothetical protein